MSTPTSLPSSTGNDQSVASGRSPQFERELGAALRRIPVPDAPAGGWPKLRQRLHLRQRCRQQWRWSGALAASLVLAAWLVPWQAPAPSGSSENELENLIALSGQLEDEWRNLRAQSRTTSGAQVQRNMALTGMIASIDGRLTGTYADPRAARDLWQQRVVLMNELVAGEARVEPAVWIN